MASQKTAQSTNFSGAARHLVLVLLAFCVASAVHFSNHYFLSVESPGSLHSGVTVRTADDASYLRPAINFIETRVWKDSNPGVGSFILRSPGYGMIAGFFIYVFGLENGLLALVFFQFALWGIAVGTVPYLARSLGLGQKTSFFSGLFVALMPMFSGFLSYTLTEAVTPALVILFYTFLLRGREGGDRWLLLSGLILGATVLVRPVLILLLLSYIPFFAEFKNGLVKVLLIALLPMFFWQLRVYRYADRFDLHPIYHSDANDLYRPLHQAVWDFHKMTGQSGSEFHSATNALLAASEGEIKDDEALTVIRRSFDKSVAETFSNEEIISTYASYIGILRQQVPYRERGAAVTTPLEGEDELIATFQSMRGDYVAKNFLHSWLAVPLGVATDLTVHSNLSLYMFQNPLRGNFLVEALRWLSFAAHLFIYSFGLVFFFRRKAKTGWAMILPAAIFFLYLVFVQRGIEERYMLPFLVPLFLLAVVMFNAVLSKVIIKLE